MMMTMMILDGLMLLSQKRKKKMVEIQIQKTTPLVEKQKAQTILIWDTISQMKKLGMEIQIKIQIKIQIEIEWTWTSIGAPFVNTAPRVPEKIKITSYNSNTQNK